MIGACTCLAMVGGPIQAFIDSDFCGQFIVITQIVMSVGSWAVFLGKFSALKAINARSRRFADDFARQDDPLTLYCDKGYPFEDSPLETVYRRTSERFVKLIPRRQLLLLQQDATACPTLTPAQMELVASTCAHATDEETVTLNRGLTALAVVTSSAPLLGLFGTVWGVMLAFQAMAASGSANIAELAPGISSALLTTVVGLVVAIPSTIAYNILQAKLEAFTVQLEGFGEELIGKLSLNYAASEKGGVC